MAILCAARSPTAQYSHVALDRVDGKEKGKKEKCVQKKTKKKAIDPTDRYNAPVCYEVKRGGMR